MARTNGSELVRDLKNISDCQHQDIRAAYYKAAEGIASLKTALRRATTKTPGAFKALENELVHANTAHDAFNRLTLGEVV